MTKMKALVCRECGKEYPTKAIHVCEMCFGPLEVKYNYDEIKKVISRKKIEDGPQSMWRYIDLLPVEGTSPIGPHAGLTPHGAGEESWRLLRPGRVVYQERHRQPSDLVVQRSCRLRGSHASARTGV